MPYVITSRRNPRLVRLQVVRKWRVRWMWADLGHQLCFWLGPFLGRVNFDCKSEFREAV